MEGNSLKLRIGKKELLKPQRGKYVAPAPNRKRFEKEGL